ncbi:MAG: KEOPS complex subunit Cgi121 [Thermoplasmata archaeon]
MREFCSEQNCEVQIADATLVFGKTHLLSAFEHAKRAFKEGRNSSTSLVNEILLYASGERQISSAISKMGIHKETTEFCILLVGNCHLDLLLQSMELKRDDSVLRGDVERLGAFGITDDEMRSVPREKVLELVLEKVAMVDLLK